MADVRYRLREPEVALETFDGDAILIDFGTGSYYSLCPTASEIVSGLAAARPPATLAATLARRYPPAAARIAGDVNALVARLLDDGVLVRAADEVPPPGGGAPNGADAASPGPAGTYAPPEVERYEDMQEMLLLDPIHDVDLQGWPVQKPDDGTPA